MVSYGEFLPSAAGFMVRAVPAPSIAHILISIYSLCQIYIRAFYTSRNNASHTLTRACVLMMLQSNPIISFGVFGHAA